MMLMRSKTSFVLVALSLAFFGQIAWETSTSPSFTADMPSIPRFVPTTQNSTAEEATKTGEFEDLLALANDAVGAKMESAKGQMTAHHVTNWVALAAIGLVTLLGALFRIHPLVNGKPKAVREGRSAEQLFTLLAILGAFAIVSQSVSTRLEKQAALNIEHLQSVSSAVNGARAAFVDSTSNREALQALNSLKRTLIDDTASAEAVSTSYLVDRLSAINL